MYPRTQAKNLHLFLPRPQVCHIHARGACLSKGLGLLCGLLRRQPIIPETCASYLIAHVTPKNADWVLLGWFMHVFIILAFVFLGVFFPPICNMFYTWYIHVTLQVGSTGTKSMEDAQARCGARVTAEVDASSWTSTAASLFRNSSGAGVWGLRAKGGANAMVKMTTSIKAAVVEAEDAAQPVRVFKPVRTSKMPRPCLLVFSSVAWKERPCCLSKRYATQRMTIKSYSQALG